MRSSLKNILEETCAAVPFTVAWYLKDHASGERAHQNGEWRLNSGSVRKVSILMAVLSALFMKGVSGWTSWFIRRKNIRRMIPDAFNIYRPESA